MKILLQIIPGCKQPKVERISDHKLKVWVDAPAKGGRANQRLLEIVAAYLNKGQKKIRIIRGHKSRNKVIEI